MPCLDGFGGVCCDWKAKLEKYESTFRESVGVGVTLELEAAFSIASLCFLSGIPKFLFPF